MLEICRQAIEKCPTLPLFSPETARCGNRVHRDGALGVDDHRVELEQLKPAEDARRAAAARSTSAPSIGAASGSRSRSLAGAS